MSKISELISELEKFKSVFGDIEISYDDMRDFKDDYLKLDLGVITAEDVSNYYVVAGESPTDLSLQHNSPHYIKKFIKEKHPDIQSWIDVDDDTKEQFEDSTNESLHDLISYCIVPEEFLKTKYNVEDDWSGNLLLLAEFYNSHDTLRKRFWVNFAKDCYHYLETDKSIEDIKSRKSNNDYVSREENCLLYLKEKMNNAKIS